MEIILVLAGAVIGVGIFVPVIAHYGKKHGCPFCKGYFSWIEDNRWWGR